MATIYDAFETRYKLDYLGLPVHNEWKNNIKRWTYYSDSFNGGNDYRSGQYLTRYVLESGDEYDNRIKNTPLDNHCKSVIETYNSFLFRKPPIRDYGTNVGNDPALDLFLADCDLEGRSYNAFMRDVSTYASVYGVVYCLIDKPSTTVSTRAEELDQKIRPYVSIITPENVIDWRYARKPNGVYAMEEITLLDGIDDKAVYYRTITATETTVYKRMAGSNASKAMEVIPNPIGVVPVVPIYSGRAIERGIGVSDIADIADVQRAIYNELSEVDQLIRISNHPSLVKSSGTQAAAGAGAIIDIPDDLDPNLKPYLIEPSGAGITHILDSIKSKVDSINRMANMGGVRNTMTTALSGVALNTEFQLLNARLAQKADNLELAEEQIWRMWALWQNTVWDGVIDYPDGFNIHDKENQIALIKAAKDTKPENTELLKELDIMLAKALITDEDCLERVIEAQQEVGAVQPMEQGEVDTAMTHAPMTNPSDMIAHMREMVQQGLTNEQIMELHPEIKDFFNGEETDNGEA